MTPEVLQTGKLSDEQIDKSQDWIDTGKPEVESMANFDFPAKLGFLFRPKRFKGSKGGRGSGKSWGFARALLIKGAQAALRVLCVREIQDSITESVYALLVQQIEKMGLDDESTWGPSAYKFNKVEIWNDLGTRFTFSGIRYNVTKIKSMEGVDICWVEEAEKISKESWDVLIPTIRKEGSEIWFCYNPNSRFDNTHVRFAARHDDECEVVTMNWRDNPWLPNVLRKEMENCRISNFKDYLHIWEGLTKEETGETILKPSWIKSWSNPNVSGNMYILLDPANSKNKKSDFTVIAAIIATVNDVFVVREIIRDRLVMEKFDKLFDMVARYQKLRYNVVVGYEKYGMQMDIDYIMERQRRENFYFKVVELGAKSTGKLSKIDRIKRLVPLFSEGRIITPPEMRYKQLDGVEVDIMDAFMQEYVTYPFIPEDMHDDILDCIARITDDSLNVRFPNVDRGGGDRSAEVEARRRKGRAYDPGTYGIMRLSIQLLTMSVHWCKILQRRLA